MLELQCSQHKIDKYQPSGLTAASDRQSDTMGSAVGKHA